MGNVWDILNKLYIKYWKQKKEYNKLKRDYVRILNFLLN